jgi:hypothetical protein
MLPSADPPSEGPALDPLLPPHPQVAKPTTAMGTIHPNLAQGPSVFMPR